MQLFQLLVIGALAAAAVNGQSATTTANVPATQITGTEAAASPELTGAAPAMNATTIASIGAALGTNAGAINTSTTASGTVQISGPVAAALNKLIGVAPAVNATTTEPTEAAPAMDADATNTSTIVSTTDITATDSDTMGGSNVDETDVIAIPTDTTQKTTVDPTEDSTVDSTKDSTMDSTKDSETPGTSTDSTDPSMSDNTAGSSDATQITMGAAAATILAIGAYFL